MANKIIHKHSSVITDNKAKLPTSEQLDYGELAVNFAAGVETISLKNSSDEIVEFKSNEYYETIINNAEGRLETLEDNQVTESTVSDWGFTKNTGTYSKPTGGIPKTDMDGGVQSSLGKADTASQGYKVFEVNVNTNQDLTSFTFDNPYNEIAYEYSANKVLPVLKLKSQYLNTIIPLVKDGDAFYGHSLYNGNRIIKVVVGYGATTISVDTYLQSVPSEYITETELNAVVENASAELDKKLDKETFDELVSGDATSAIESFKEVTAFLEGIEDSENLDSIIAAKQDKLVSGTNIKTINGSSILTNGNINAIPSGGSSGKFLGWDSSGKAKWVNNPNTDMQCTSSTYHYSPSEDGYSKLSANNQEHPKGVVKSILRDNKGHVTGIEIEDLQDIVIDSELSETSTNPLQNKTIYSLTNQLTGLVNDKQDTLVSGTNIKTIWGKDILGSGNLIEGNGCTASGVVSHVEGSGTTASGGASHAEGASTKAVGDNAHAEGSGTEANGHASHAEGINTKAENNQAHAEGSGTTASGEASHAEGLSTTASGDQAHAEGSNTTASGLRAHAEGAVTTASGNDSHAEGDETIAEGKQSHAEGHKTHSIGSSSHAEGKSTIARGEHSHAEGEGTESAGSNSHSEGYNTKAMVDACHAEGYETQAGGLDDDGFPYGNYSHAEGHQTFAAAFGSHVEGYLTTTEQFNESGQLVYYAHAEGNGTVAAGSNSHAEGYHTMTNANNSHAEGYETIANGDGSHAEGYNTIANGIASHAGGYGTVTNNVAEHACGRYNVSNQGDTAADNTIFSVGIGNEAGPKNGLEVRENGDVYIQKDGSYIKLQGELSNTLKQTDVDSALSETSTNPLQNKIIYSLANQLLAQVNAKQDKLLAGSNIKTINGDSILRSGNLNLITPTELRNQCYLKSEIDNMLGDINRILENIVNGGNYGYSAAGYSEDDMLNILNEILA